MEPSSFIFKKIINKQTNKQNPRVYDTFLTILPIWSQGKFFSYLPSLFHHRILKSTKSAEDSIATEHSTFESCNWKWFRKIYFFSFSWNLPEPPHKRLERPQWAEAWIWELLLQPYPPISLVLASQSSLSTPHQITQRSIK